MIDIDIDAAGDEGRLGAQCDGQRRERAIDGPEGRALGGLPDVWLCTQCNCPGTRRGVKRDALPGWAWRLCGAG